MIPATCWNQHIKIIAWIEGPDHSGKTTSCKFYAMVKVQAKKIICFITIHIKQFCLQCIMILVIIHLKQSSSCWSSRWQQNWRATRVSHLHLQQLIYRKVYFKNNWYLLFTEVALRDIATLAAKEVQGVQWNWKEPSVYFDIHVCAPQTEITPSDPRHQVVEK